jgi:putative peptidoglycan lipid II flippase
MFMGPVSARGESLVAGAIARLANTMSVLDLRHAGLALSTSVAATVNLVLLFAVLRRRLGGLPLAPLLSSLGRSLAASLVMVLPVRWLAGQVDWSVPGHLPWKLVMLAAAVSLGVGLYVAAAYLLGGEDVRRASRLLRERW